MVCLARSRDRRQIAAVWKFWLWALAQRHRVEVTLRKLGGIYLHRRQVWLRDVLHDWQLGATRCAFMGFRSAQQRQWQTVFAFSVSRVLQRVWSCWQRRNVSRVFGHWVGATHRWAAVSC